MISLVRMLAALLAGSALAPLARAQTAGPATFEAAGDAAVRRAADSLELTASQRTVFFENVDTAVAYGLAANPSGGRPAVDSALVLVVRETGRKMQFVRHARVIFSDMFARRANDRDRAPGTEEELWRSPANVAMLIELYRDNPNASDHDMERAMAAAFKREE
jgi:hypothetical protein